MPEAPVHRPNIATSEFSSGPDNCLSLGMIVWRFLKTHFMLQCPRFSQAYVSRNMMQQSEAWAELRALMHSRRFVDCQPSPAGIGFLTYYRKFIPHMPQLGH